MTGNFSVLISYRQICLSALKNNLVPLQWKPVAVADRSEAWTVFDRSETVIAGSNPALYMDV
jgi:hypothetical protein